MTFMLRPPPPRGMRVTLTCGCEASVRVGVRVAIVYWIRIDVPQRGCRRAHRGRTHRLVGLEDMQATPRAEGCTPQK